MEQRRFKGHYVAGEWGGSAPIETHPAETLLKCSRNGENLAHFVVHC